MLTIKWIEPSTHREWVAEVLEVSLYPCTSNRDAVDGRPMLYCLKPDNSTIEFQCGDIWVMNENGKTVADYHLGPIGPVPTMRSAEEENGKDRKNHKNQEGGGR